MISRGEEPRRNGTCELCGGHGRELRILAVADFIRWACETCRRELQQSVMRMYCGTGEESEPAE